ncbi:MAG: molecular chaperone TorD family protein [Deltaproteobacteria bacterium]|nr:molecular chaperone TorD family protein [Deltaproteobacteria bacterium]
MASPHDTTTGLAWGGEGNLRSLSYHLIGGLLRECPTAELLDGMRTEGVLERLAAKATGAPALSAALGRLGQSLRETEHTDAIRTDYGLLFLGLGRKALAPPWESLYRAEDREVWGEPAREVLRCYAEAGVGYDGMKQIPPDHVGLELTFLATLADREPAGSEAQRHFVDRHLAQWIPAFVDKVKGGAKTGFMRALAEALHALIALDQRFLAGGQQREAGVADPAGRG